MNNTDNYLEKIEISSNNMHSLSIRENNEWIEFYVLSKMRLSIRKENVVTVESHCKSIPDGYREGNQTIEAIVLPNSVTEVGENAFFRCENVKIVVLGSGLKTIGQCAFTGLKRIKYVYYAGTTDEYEMIEQGEPFEYLGLITCNNGIVKTVNYKDPDELQYPKKE